MVGGHTSSRPLGELYPQAPKGAKTKLKARPPKASKKTVARKGKVRVRREPSPSPPVVDPDPVYDPEEDRDKELEEAAREMEMEEEDFGEDERAHSVGASVGASAGSASSSGTGKVYQRGPTGLPKRPAFEAEKPAIRPSPPKGWERIAVGCHTMQPNNVLGVLLKDHFPGMVQMEGKEEPEVAWTWAHYKAQKDFQDNDTVVFVNKAERVKGEFRRYFKVEEGHEAALERVLEADATRECLR